MHMQCLSLGPNDCQISSEVGKVNLDSEMKKICNPEVPIHFGSPDVNSCFLVPLIGGR